SYKGRFIGTDDELENLINEETWLKADECMTLGFCDEVLEEVEETEEKDTKEDINTKEELLNKYSKDLKIAANTKDKEKKTMKKKTTNKKIGAVIKKKTETYNSKKSLETREKKKVEKKNKMADALKNNDKDKYVEAQTELAEMIKDDVIKDAKATTSADLTN